MRIRPSAITFEEHAPRVSSRSETLIEYPELEVVRRRRVRTPRRGRRDQPLRGARRRRPERDREVDACEAVRGLVGTGRGELDFALDIAYKPQYIDIDQPMRVDVFLSSITDDFGSSYWNTEIAQPLQLDRVMEQNLSDLSGGAPARRHRGVSPKTPICTFSRRALCAPRRGTAGARDDGDPPVRGEPRRDRDGDRPRHLHDRSPRRPPDGVRRRTGRARGTPRRRRRCATG